MQVLYRKYRPKTFAEVEGQEHVVRTLQGALMSGRVGHAYLFCGPRGTGKTTMARLLAKTLNCQNLNTKPFTLNAGTIEPCNLCYTCTEINEGRSLDLIEIDAASNRGIDEIRNLKDSAVVAASSGRYKVFIIDEVHMLTPPAFNALLKILEEPPSHVIFILATTEPHKVLDTILSRVQRFDFKKIQTAEIVKKLKRVAENEKVKVGDGALAMLASVSGGSLRDAESALGKVIAYSGVADNKSPDEISSEHISDALGIVPFTIHENLLSLLSSKKSQEAITQVSELYEAGVDLDHFIKQFVRYARSSLVENLGKPARPAGGPVAMTNATYSPQFLVATITQFLKASNDMRYSPIPQLPLELAILELTK